MINAAKFIQNNKLTAYICFTILNECCKEIMLYHNIKHIAIGDTNIDKFYILPDYKCILSPINPEPFIPLNNYSKYKDFSIFFSTFNESIGYKNSHFGNYLTLYKKDVNSKIF